MRFVRPSTALMLLALATAPLGAQARGDAITRLEAARARSPENAAALRALGVAYYKAQRFAEALPVLDQARRLNPKDGVSAVYTGMAAEKTGDLTTARRAYETYLQVGTSRRAKNDVRARLVALARAESVAAAKAAVANEARLSQTPSNPLVVAVPPLRFTGADSMLKPLERGIADLLITDLAVSSRITVVERDRMQALADEIRLSESSRVDAATAVRAGKLIQAGTLMNGVIQQTGTNSVTLDVSPVSVQTGGIGEPASANNTLEQIFDMEKRVVLQLFARLNVALTPAEMQRVARRPTSNLQAFLSYSRGLQAVDDGRFEDATRFFDNARTLDPGFGAAAARFQAAQAASQGAAVTTTTIEAGLSGSESQVVSSAVQGSSAPTSNALEEAARRAAQTVNPPATNLAVGTGSTTVTSAPPERDAPSSTGGTDIPTRTGQVIIVIRRP
jgi:tetratricopeptide (TPR) repeat protein